MQEYNVMVELPEGQVAYNTVSDEATLQTLAMEYQDKYESTILLAMVDGKLRELNKKVVKDCKVSFVTMTDRDGNRAYRRSVTLLLEKAVAHIFGSHSVLRVLHSLGNGMYCEIDKTAVTEELLAKLRETMLYFVDKDAPIKKESMKTDAAEAMFRECGFKSKERLLHYRRSSRVNIYELDGVMDYFYGYMVPSTRYLKIFDLVLYGDGFVLVFPDAKTGKVEPFATSSKLYETLQESRKWSKKLGIGNIGALNDAIAAGKGEELILLQEALMEQQIGALAEEIAQSGHIKFVMIAGPSSSGKTSFSNRLSIQLTAKGFTPHPIGLDDYYIDRTLCPRDENGELDLECLEALDVEQFNKDMTSLLNGERVLMPSFNFKTGKREYRGNSLQLGKEDILVIEGIHGLNPRLSYSLPDESKFRIYISALTQLNIDDHNPLPTTDGRLLRRIVRDARTRGTDARETIAMWPSVRRGEEKYIFPFQDGADVMFNSALVYELAVLKVYAEPLLFQIPRDCPEYLEAKRLLKFLDYFLPLPTEAINRNSLAREFVGGSCFHV